MTELEMSAEKQARARKIEIVKLFAYFALLFVGIRLLHEIFKEISNTTYFAELSRLSGLAATSFDTAKSFDDVLVTLFTLTLTLLLVLPVAWVYVLTNSGKANQSLTHALVSLSIIVSGVMMLLHDNLARSFSLVGVVAAVRYRNTLKDPKDAVFVFLSIGIGMACGLHATRVAIVLTVFECAILLVLWASHTGAPPQPLIAGDGKKPNAILLIEVKTGAHRGHLSADMEDHRGKWRLSKMEEVGEVTVLEYLGRLPKKKMPPLHFMERLKKSNPDVKQITFHSLRKAAREAPGDDGVRLPAARSHKESHHA